LGAFGEKLRKQREQQGITLDAISGTTKISTRMLRALEDEHFDQLPGGVFNKGFVRAYARQVGLDEQEAVADYLAATQGQPPSSSPDLRASATKPSAIAVPDLPGNDGSHEVRETDFRKEDDTGGSTREDRRKRGRRHEDLRNNCNNNNDDGSATPVSIASSLTSRSRPKYSAGSPAPLSDDPVARIPWGKLAVTLLLVTLAFALWNSRRHAQPKAASQPVASSTQPSTSAPVPFSAPAATTPSSSAGSPSPAKASPSATRSPAKPSPGASPAATATRASTTPPEAASPASSLPAEPIATSSAAANSPPAITLLIRAEKTAWVSIMADGKPVAAETLIAPAHSSVRASREIVVKTGNAAGVSFLLNGKEIPAEGNDGEVKTYIFDAAGVRVLPQTQPPASNR
jgi:cytoskeletal protein RodZ